MFRALKVMMAGAALAVGGMALADGKGGPAGHQTGAHHAAPQGHFGLVGHAHHDSVRSQKGYHHYEPHHAEFYTDYNRKHGVEFSHGHYYRGFHHTHWGWHYYHPGYKVRLYYDLGYRSY